MSEDYISKLNSIFVAIFELNTDVGVENIDNKNCVKWDSLAHVSLIAACESEFNISIEVSDYENLISYSAVKKCIENHQV